MSSEEIIKSLGTHEPLTGSDDEESFVVLGNGSLDEPASFLQDDLPPIRTSKIHDMQQLIQMEISQINSSNPILDIPAVGISTSEVTSSTSLGLGPDSSHEDIQKQVEALIRENEKLKNVIAQNNISMKNQYDKIFTWKEDVTKVMKSHKEKLSEAKTYIDTLKDENAKIASDIDVYVNIKKLQEEEIFNLKEQMKLLEGGHKIRDSAEQDVAQFDLSALKEKVEDLQNALAEANLKNNEMSTENETLGNELIAASSVQEELRSKQDEIESLRSEIAARSVKEKTLSEQVIELEGQLSELHIAQNDMCEKNQELIYKEQQARDAKTKLLEQQLQTAAFAEANWRTMVMDLKSQVQQLEEANNPRLEEDYMRAREQLSLSQSTVTALQEEISGKVRKIEELQRLLQESSKEENFAFKQQLEIYKSDFDAEQESKNAIKQERDKLAEDLQNLQKRNKQLENELDTSRLHTRPGGFPCPKCAFSFQNYQSLENHVHRCLDLDGFP